MEKIAVIGIGRLGLCLALNLERVGYEVWGIDCLPEYVEAVKNKKFSSTEPLVNEYLQTAKHFQAGTDLKVIEEQNIKLIFIVLPTPSSADGSFDHSYIESVVDELLKFGRQNEPRHLIINSTTMPGYCDALNKKVGPFNYNVLYNPEFIAQGTIMVNQQYPDQVLIGETNEATGNELEKVYRRLCKNKPAYCRMNLISAEITKLATNCFLTTKISFANAIGDLAIQVGAEQDKILEAIGSDSRIGNKFLKYGFGFGGPCFPRDNKAFAKFALGQKQALSIAEATDKTNALHHEFLVGEWTKKYSDTETVLFDSVTYKKGTDILEESQQLKLALALAEAGKKVKIIESESVINQLKELYGNVFSYELRHDN